MALVEFSDDRRRLRIILARVVGRAAALGVLLDLTLANVARARARLGAHAARFGAHLRHERLVRLALARLHRVTARLNT